MAGSGDKRKLGPVESFVTVTKKTLTTSSSTEESGSDQSQLVTLESAQPINVEVEEPENTDSSEGDKLKTLLPN